ncbi:MAG: hypothetical protein LBE12_04060 [Planctomycetaceae bacterium]|nr:hypothetical protein [Planctomycetaceae bacterium]
MNSSQADYYRNGNNSACDTIHSPLFTINYSLTPSGVKSEKRKFHG